MTMATNNISTAPQVAQAAIPAATIHNNQSNATNASSNNNSGNSNNINNFGKSFNDGVEKELLKIIDSSLFTPLLNLDIDQLEGKDIMGVLPFLAKLLLNPSFVKRQQLFRLLYPIRKMNDVIHLMLARNIETYDLSAPFSVLSFESCDYVERLRIVGAEFMKIQDKARQTTKVSTNTNLKLSRSELFDNPIYVDDISYCLCMFVAKSTPNSMINILDMCETLLNVKYGSTYIIRLVANMPDRCQEVCHSLITYGERQDEGANFNEISEQRAKTLRMLCLMNPSMAYTVRSITLQLCKMPSLTIMITLDNLFEALEDYDQYMSEKMDIDGDRNCENSNLVLELEYRYDSAIAFITGILLGVDDGTRTWFAQYTKSAQQKRIDQSHPSILSKFRYLILEYVNRLFPTILDEEFPNELMNGKKTKSKSDAIGKMNRTLIRLTATLRFFCALRGIGSLKLNPEESEILLRLITCKPIVNRTSVNFATTGVCTLLACSALINNQKEEKRAGEWLKWLIKDSNYSDNRYSSHGKCSISELLLLIAIHFQNNQNNQIAELVCATLGMKLQVKASVAKCKSLFVQEVFNDQMVAEHAVKVPVTKNLNNNITEFLPVHCIHQLLESRSFSKHQVPIKDWIFKQVCESSKPIHNILPKLIEAYVNSVIVSTSIHGHCGTNQPIPEEDIAKIFKTRLYSVDATTGNAEPPTIVPYTNIKASKTTPEKKKASNKRKQATVEPMEVDGANDVSVNVEKDPEVVDVETAQVLLLLYLVLYEDIRLKKNPDMSSTERSKLVKYSQDFMMEIPIFYLLQLVRENQNSFGTILPDLIKLVTSQYPQLCSIQHWLTVEHYEPHNSETYTLALNKISYRISPMSLTKSSLINGIVSESKNTPTFKLNLMKQLTYGFEHVEEDPLALAKTVSHILALSKEEIWSFVNLFVGNLSKIIRLQISNSPEYKKLIEVTTKLWWKFNTIFPRKLWVMTVNALRGSHNCKSTTNVELIEYSWDELALDPLIALRCDKRVFRCVDTLNIVLHILGAFLAASRRCLQDQMNEQPRQRDNRNLEELKTTLILAQTSAAIQILLESCIPTDAEQEAINKRESGLDIEEDEKILLDRLDVSINCICEHLHQVFIADTNLAKLVHFQTYPSELLPITSNKIPSMHICLDFIPELLAQPDISKQVFVIELTSHLCEKYAITKSLNVAKLCFNVAYTLLQLLPSERRALFFLPVLPALIRIGKVFPILREDADIILNQINQITIAHMASTSSRLGLGSTRPFDGLEKMTWRETKKLMGKLNLQEALYLSIQKCSLDLDHLKSLKQDGNPFIMDKPSGPIYNTIFAYGNHVINPSGS